MGWFSEAVGKDPALLASSCYCLVYLPKMIWYTFRSHHCSCLPIIHHCLILPRPEVWPRSMGPRSMRVCVHTSCARVLCYLSLFISTSVLLILYHITCHKMRVVVYSSEIFRVRRAGLKQVSISQWVDKVTGGIVTYWLPSLEMRLRNPQVWWPVGLLLT